MVKYVRMDTISFKGNTSAKAEHEHLSMKSSGGTNIIFALVISLDAMLSKTQQRYLMKLCVAGKDIMSVPLWSKRKGGNILNRAWRGPSVHVVVRKGPLFCHAYFSNGVPSCENGHDAAIRKIPLRSTKIHPPQSCQVRH
jgi:hypothetical protein